MLNILLIKSLHALSQLDRKYRAKYRATRIGRSDTKKAWLRNEGVVDLI